MIEPPFHYQFRLILIGDSTVGKSTLLRVFTEGRFNENTDPTVGVDFFSKIIEIKDGVRIKLQLWDTGESTESLVAPAKCNLIVLLFLSCNKKKKVQVSCT